MLLPVVVDLGPNAQPSELAVVLDACNEVIAAGACVAAGDGQASEAVRARARAQPQDPALRVVRIEVELAGELALEPLVRELEFQSGDPRAERWRSVGLAIATLVGRAEAAERDDAAPATEAPPDASEASGAVEPSPAPPGPSVALPDEAVPDEVVPAEAVTDEAATDDTGRDASAAPVQRAWAPFVALGGVLGPGLDDGSWRAGVTVRGGWHMGSGWFLCGAGEYAVRTAGPVDFDVSWLSLELGGSYRVVLSNAWSAGVSLLAGARRLGLRAELSGVEAARSLWNPSLALGVDAWWRPSEGFGVWGSIDGRSAGRSTRLRVAGRTLASTPPVDVGLGVGLGWWFE